MADVVLFDVDGTLALMNRGEGGRGPFDWKRVGEDAPNPAVVDLAHMIIRDCRYQIIVMSGRDEVCRPETEKWLSELQVFYAELYMRPHRDNRKDSVVKAELYRQHILGRHDVRWVVDDRDQVVRMWREEFGLTVFQCAPGDF